jgi:mono/diheme cytochrome c family protein
MGRKEGGVPEGELARFFPLTCPTNHTYSTAFNFAHGSAAMQKLAFASFAAAALLTPSPHRAADVDKEKVAGQAYAVFQKFCSECHRLDHPHGNKKYAVLDWNSLTKEKPSEKILKKHPDAKAYIVPNKPAESLVWIRVSKREMPPEDEPQPTETDRAAIKKWIEAGAPKEGFKAAK